MRYVSLLPAVSGGASNSKTESAGCSAALAGGGSAGEASLADGGGGDDGGDDGGGGPAAVAGGGSADSAASEPDELMARVGSAVWSRAGETLQRGPAGKNNGGKNRRSLTRHDQEPERVGAPNVTCAGRARAGFARAMNAFTANCSAGWLRDAWFVLHAAAEPCDLRVAAFQGVLAAALVPNLGSAALFVVKTRRDAPTHLTSRLLVLFSLARVCMYSLLFACTLIWPASFDSSQASVWVLWAAANLCFRTQIILGSILIKNMGKQMAEFVVGAPLLGLINPSVEMPLIAMFCALTLVTALLFGAAIPAVASLAWKQAAFNAGCFCTAATEIVLGLLSALWLARLLKALEATQHGVHELIVHTMMVKERNHLATRAMQLHSFSRKLRYVCMFVMLGFPGGFIVWVLIGTVVGPSWIFFVCFALAPLIQDWYVFSVVFKPSSSAQPAQGQRVSAHSSASRKDRVSFHMHGHDGPLSTIAERTGDFDPSHNNVGSSVSEAVSSSPAPAHRRWWALKM